MFVGSVVPVASVKKLTPSSKSNSSSKRIPDGVDSELLSNVMPSFTVLDTSPSVLITFSNVVLNTCVFVSQPDTVPVCVVKVLPEANVPVTSFNTKWAWNVASGGLLESKSKLLSLISIPFTLPISVVFDLRLALVPDVLVTVTVGNLEYPLPPSVTFTFLIDVASASVENVSSSKANKLLFVNSSAVSCTVSVNKLWLACVDAPSVPFNNNLLTALPFIL